jgi:hypothetical protein
MTYIAHLILLYFHDCRSFVLLMLSYFPHEQITLRVNMRLSGQSLDLLLSRCTMLSSLTLAHVTDLCGLLSMVAEKGCRIQHLTICGPFGGGFQHITQQLVGTILLMYK